MTRMSFHHYSFCFTKRLLHTFKYNHLRTIYHIFDVSDLTNFQTMHNIIDRIYFNINRFYIVIGRLIIAVMFNIREI